MLYTLSKTRFSLAKPAAIAAHLVSLYCNPVAERDSLTVCVCVCDRVRANKVASAV